MKLLTVTSFFDTHPGGLENVAGALARALSTRGFHVTWLASDATATPSEQPRLSTRSLPAWNVTERRFGFPYPILGIRGFARIVSEVRAADAVLIHDALYLTSFFTFLCARVLGRRALVVQHISEVPYRNPVLRGLMRLGNRVVTRPLLAAADQVVFISRTTADHFAGIHFRRAPRLVFNGVDTTIFQPEGREAARAALRAPDGPIALFVGRFVEKKGLHILRRAVEARPDVTWWFAGWGPLDPVAWSAPNVRVFAGRTGAALAQLYRAADAVVLPSRGEGFPLVVQEGLACGKPVVCSDEILTADPEARPYLYGVEIGGEDAAEDAERLCAGLDRALAEGVETAAPRRVAFAAEHYAASRTVDSYHAILLRWAAERSSPAIAPLEDVPA